MAALFTLNMRIGAIGDPPPIHDRRALRREIERQIETLIGALDAMDGDTEAEDDGTAEPSLGWSFTYAGGAGDDCEDTSPEWHGSAA